MLKKCLITIAVVALLATTVHAATEGEGTMKNEGWPFQWTVTYDTLDICKFDVILEVGYYVQIKDCDKLGPLKLEQVNCDTIDISDDVQGSGDFPCYKGCVDFEARANFAAVFGADFDRGAGDVNIIDKDGFDLQWGLGDNNQITNSGSYEDLKLCMVASNVKLWKSGGATGTVKVGEITITVKPPLANDSGNQNNWPPSP